jgi:hypothetical protein
VSDVRAARDRQKVEWDWYRQAATRLFPNVSISPTAAVSEDQDKTGGFIHVVIWVPREEMLKEEPPPQPDPLMLTQGWELPDNDIPF